MTNLERANRAKKALLAEYSDVVSQEPLEIAIGDLICDLLHLNNCTQDSERDAATILLLAEINFEEELTENA